jgi:hypothetical protein
VCQATASAVGTMAAVARMTIPMGSECNRGFYANSGGVCTKCTVCKSNMCAWSRTSTSHRFHRLTLSSA